MRSRFGHYIDHSPLCQVILSRAREFYREPEAVFWAYGFPVLMIIGLGIAFRNQPIEQISVDIVESAGAVTAKAALEKQEKFVAEIHDAETCRVRLRTGKTDLVVAATNGTTPEYEYRFDPTRPESVLARNAVDDALERSLGRTDIAKRSDVEFAEPGGRYIDFLVPGLLGMGLMGGGLWGIGFLTVDMRIRKLLKRYLATPMKKSHFLGGIMISRLLFMIPEVFVMIVFSRLLFGVKIYGSIAAVVALTLLGAVMFAGLGLLVASRAKTIETVSGLMNLVMLPMWMLSGIFFSPERFPEAAQPFIHALPLTPLIAALRAVMLEGASLASQASDIAIMVGWSVVTFALALKLFRWN